MTAQFTQCILANIVDLICNIIIIKIIIINYNHDIYVVLICVLNVKRKRGKNNNR